MENPKIPASQQQRVDDPRSETTAQAVDAARKARIVFVDPYDPRAEPPPEEPGYGHGV